MTTQALRGSLHAVSIDTVKSVREREHQLAHDGLGELEHQFHIHLDGTAETLIAWTSVDISFDVDFFHAEEQRDSPLDVPHFLWGSYLPEDELATDPPAIQAHVTGWTRDDRGAFIGATVKIGVWSPGGDSLDYQGWVHVSFQGWGAPAENEAALDVGT